MQIIKDSIKTIIVSLLVLSFTTVALAWTEPTSTPPAGNTSAPINTGSTTQYKSGSFGVTTPGGYSQTLLQQWGLYSPGTMFIEPGGGSNLYLTDQWNKTGMLNIQFGKTFFESGNVGVGINPGATYKLDVAGDINMTGGLYISGTRKDTVWDGKQAAITGGASTIATSNLTANRALVSDASGKVAVSGTTSTELGYVSGVTSAIQTQLNTKAPTASPTFTGSINFPGGIWNSGSQVGIGTTNPGLYMLNVQSGSSAILGQSSGSGSSGVRGYNSSSGYGGNFYSISGTGVYGYGANSGYDFYAGNSSGRSYFAGRVGIGTVPSYKFEVYGGTSYFNSGNPLWNAISTNGGAYIGGTIRGATYGFGGMYVHNFEGNNACVYQNPFTGFCSCPSGFTASQITVWSWNEHNTNTFYCYK